jgi:hypothetical protein
LNVDKRWGQYRNQSLLAHIEENALLNKNVTYEPPDGCSAPEYFKNMYSESPTPEEFRQWELKSSFTSKKTHVPKNPKMMQPK